jgi:hypothetical protein
LNEERIEEQLRRIADALHHLLRVQREILRQLEQRTYPALRGITVKELP